MLFQQHLTMHGKPSDKYITSQAETEHFTSSLKSSDKICFDRIMNTKII